MEEKGHKRGEIRTEKAWRGLRDKQQSDTHTEGDNYHQVSQFKKKNPLLVSFSFFYSKHTQNFVGIVSRCGFVKGKKDKGQLFPSRYS